MNEHVVLDSQPDLEGGPLICAFRGWNDGGDAATIATGYLRDRWGAERFGGVDPEEFYDFQVTRPSVRLVEGITRKIDWPANDFFAATEQRAALLIGIEPNVHWRAYCGAIIDTARAVRAGTLIALGAFLADIPHTADSPVAGSAGDPEQAARLGLSPTRYEGPTGIVGVLNDSAAQAGLASISLWAAVPHYLPAGPNPKAALALVRTVSRVIGVDVETDTLARAAATWQTQVSEMIEENPDLRSYVRRLEDSREERGDLDEIEIPSGDALAAELERFLRQHRDEGEA